MIIIQVTNNNELPNPRICFVAEINPEDAALQMKANHGIDPPVAYVWHKPSGKCNVYFPAIDPNGVYPNG